MDEACDSELETDLAEDSSSWEEGNIEADVPMARRSQCSDAGDNPLDPNYLPPHYREDYRLAIDALVEEDVDGYYKFLQFVDVVDFLSPSEIDYIHNSIQLPKQSSHPEQRYLDTSGDSSSDTYWPLHSDLDAPGLDLGWPQSHHLIGPTEVTTLVNPAAPDMPSIKEQARRLIKNAQMVIAVVMDMFTDVDIFADILNAAMRNVAVYLLLDEANVQHFINMVNKCRVNLQSLQYLRVRTVTGIRYHCRTGKSFKGQMLDRFILTDCRAVLSGNYSFMWSYEKLHRCMAHLFLGQLVSTFDEEFRILFAQSEPLIIENMEDITVLPKHSLPGERSLLRDTRKYRTMDTGQEDWRMNQIKRQDTFHGPLDIYNRYPSPQSRLDPQTRLEPQFDQGPPRIMDSLAHKRHSFAEGAGTGRYNLPYQQQGLPDVEQPGRPYYRGQQHLHPRDEPDYGGYGQMDKFWNQDFQQEEPYPEPGYPRDIEPHEGYDPVFNYLSSRNVEIDQSSDKLIPGPDLPYSTTHPRRQNINQAYACQTSPTPSNTTEKKSKQEHGSDRKDPTVRKGLRNWRISSYLSAYDSSGEPEGLSMGQGSTTDPFDDMPYPTQQPTPPPPAAVDLAVPKIPNVREFKVPALPRASQMPAFAKTTARDFPKRFPDEMPPQLVVPEPKVITPTPSESSSTTDGEKQEEPEQREPITSALRRDDPFRRKFNASAVQRSSRLRGSLLFSSLDQNPDNTEQEDDKTKAETDQTKLPFVSQVLAQRRAGTREPFEWRSYIKSTDNAKAEEGGSKQDEKDSESKLESQKESLEVAKSETVKSKELASKVDKAFPSQIEQPKIEQQPPPPMQQPLLSESFLDMNDPDQRFSFFKELAAKRRAAKAAEEAKLKQETPAKDKKDEKKKEEQQPQKDVSKTSDKSKEDSKKIDAKTLALSGKKVSPATQSCEKVETKIVTKDKEEPNKAVKTQKNVVSTTVEKPKEESKKTDVSSKMDSGVKNQPTATQSCEKIVTKVATDSEKIEAKQNQASRPTSTEKLTQEKGTSQVTDAAKSAGKQDKPPEANVAAAQAVTEETQPATTTDATSKDPLLKTSRSVPDFAKASMSDMLSSLPSARMSERSSQEGNKDTATKPRLWSPSLHRREPLKAFGEKPKSVSTVVQIEEATEAASPSSVTHVKSQTGDKTETKQNQVSKVETATSATGTKESAKVKSQYLPAITENTQPQQDGKETSPSSKKSSALPIIPETSSAIPDKAKPQTENSSAKSTTGAIQVKEDSKDSTHSQSITPEQTKAEEKTELPAKEAIDKEALVKSSASEQCKKPTQAAVEQTNQDKASDVKDSENPSPSQSIASVEQPLKDQHKTELKQPLNQTEQEKCSDEQAHTSVKPVQPEKLAEKPNVVDKGVTKEPCPKEKADKSASTIEKSSGETTPSGKDRAKEAGQLGPIEKTSIVTQEEVELTADSLVLTPNSKDAEKSSSASPEGPVPFSSEEAKQKCPVTSSEDFTLLESHSNTSSPASFATAVEFMSSEDSDMLSPAKGDQQHLFKSENAESSISDMSDFETPNSEISMSPMPSAVDMDDTFEDNVSIAETVIEAASRRKSEAIEERKVDGEANAQTQESQEGLSQESGQIELPQERPSPETSTDNMVAATAKSEATTQSPTTKEVLGSVTTREDSAKTVEDGKLGEKIASTAKSEKEVVSNTQFEGSNTTKESSVCPASSQVEQETKMAEKATKVMTESSIKEKSDPANEGSKEVKDVKTQNLTSQSETKGQLSKEKTADPTSPATSEERKGTKVEDKTPEITTKDGSRSTESKKESKDVKSLEPSVSTINKEAEIKPESIETSPINQSATSPATDVTKEAKTVAKVSEISSKDSAVGKEPTPEAKTRTVSSRFLSEPSTAPVKTQASAVTPKVTQEVTIVDEIKEKSQSNGETGIASIMKLFKEAKEKQGQNLETRESETKPVETDTNTEISNVEAKMVDKTTENKSKEATVASENVVSEKDDKGESMTEVSSSASSAKQSQTGPAKQETKTTDKASEITAKDTAEAIEKCSIESQADVSKETKSETEISSPATSEDTKVLDKESKVIKEMSTDDQSEQKSKDTGVNSKDTNPEPAKAIETAPPSAQPKQQPKPSPSRYLSSTANVISSSNLRDDTKILLEKISAQSQSRNESAAAKEAPVTDDEKEDEADKNAKRKKENELRSSLGQQKSSQEREKVLERIQTMRKDRKVYSRFEL